MDFYWMPITSYQPKLSIYEPHWSPVFPGPCFAIWKDFLEKLDYMDVEVGKFSFTNFV